MKDKRIFVEQRPQGDYYAARAFAVGIFAISALSARSACQRS